MTHRLQRAALVALATACVFSASCSKNRGEDDVLPDIPMVSEGVLACESMLKDFDRIDPDNAEEDELARAMTVAHDYRGMCERQFLANADTPADKAFYQHRAQQFRLNELLFEAALSRRFDAFTGYCVILSDMRDALVEGSEVMDAFFRDYQPTGEDLRRLTELYRLDAYSIEVLNTQISVTCEPAGASSGSRGSGSGSPSAR